MPLQTEKLIFESVLQNNGGKIPTRGLISIVSNRSNGKPDEKEKWCLKSCDKKPSNKLSKRKKFIDKARTCKFVTFMCFRRFRVPHLKNPCFNTEGIHRVRMMMDHQSDQAFHSDESDLDMQVQVSDKKEEIEDLLPDNLELCGVEDEKFVEQPVGNISANEEGLEPYVDMEFSSRDEAREFYIAYGRRIGFTVRIHHNRRSRVNNQVIGQDFVCSKEGFRAKKYVYRKDRVLPPPPVTREGCQAMIRLALRDGGKWVVTKFVKEHSHKLMSPSKVPWRGSGKHLVSEDEKDKRIRELSLELYNERQKCKRRCAAYEEQLNMILNDLEKHTEHISKKVADIVQSMREIEEEKSDSDCG
ncbi:hypothetical protein L6164_023862 [Bauhinia variegata]|uniref:Uncharacterized protein n=1 Tax=Bauhinia variegata TaxID=167791 RepID=A0ACB9ML41_BAUVA|nr:hypothetical protein L6164_023862 [Bauhinia variegata]